MRTARRGKRIHGGCWLLRYAPSRRKSARIGISVAKRFIRRAVPRNRLRRVIREEFRQRWRADLPPMDVIVTLAAPPDNEDAAKRECAALFASAAAIVSANSKKQ